MGLMDGTMSKGSDDMSMDADREKMLMQKMNDGTITEAERDELMQYQKRSTDSKL
jgi:hypothetical protein